MAKQTMSHPHDGILPGNKKEWTTNIYNNIDDSQMHYAEWKNPDLISTFCDIQDEAKL